MVANTIGMKSSKNKSHYLGEQSSVVDALKVDPKGAVQSVLN